jgi:23S rRNA pseudouridine1911/1915/1917 synthase
MRDEIDEPVEELNEDSPEGLFLHHKLVVDPGQDLLRIDKFLFNRIPKVSRNRIQQAADAGLVKVNGKEVKSSYRIKPNDVITLELPHPKNTYNIDPEPIPLKIVFEDEHLIIIDKQAGLVVHPGVGNFTGTLVNALMYHLNQLPQTPGAEHRPGLVHRIDKNTSGLIVVAKTDLAMARLAKQFFDHTIERKYIALVWGVPEKNSGTIVGNIARDLRNRKMMAVFPEGDHGKHAVTHYKVIEKFNYTALVECQLETGRTHQIRVHMKHIGHPLFNDDTYGGDRIVKGTVHTKYKQFVENAFALLPRQALHAQVLGFEHPLTREHVHFESPLPADFSAVVEKWRKYVAN